MEQRSKPVGQAKQERSGAYDPERPADDSSVPWSSGEDEKIRQVFDDLTDEERIVSILKKVGFSNTEIATGLGVSVEAIMELSRTAYAKVRVLRPLLARTPRSDGGLPLNCPLCGSRLAYQGEKRSWSVYTCDSHGVFLLDSKRGLRHAGKA